MIELIGFAFLAGLIWLTIGLISGLLIHYLDHSENEILVPTLIVAMVGAVLGGFLANYFFQTQALTISDLMISTASALLLTIIGRILLKSAEKEVTSDYEYATYSQISRPKSSAQISQLLTEIEYPVSKADLWRLAKQQGASREDLKLLENLPNRLYQDAKELKKELE